MIKIGKIFDSGFTLEAEGETIKAAIESFTSSCGAEFLTEESCPYCKSKNIVPNHRIAVTGEGKQKKSYNYYEIKCLTPGCWAVLELGQKQDLVGLFPKRKDENGNYLPNKGWKKNDWKKED